MLLKSLRLKNFRQYKGNQTIEFSIDPQRNVTVILGNNTFGKTTLLQAFNWCFYQKASLHNSANLLNYDIAEELPNGGKADVEVEICLIHNSTDYTITTSQEYIKKGATVFPQETRTAICYMRADGQTEPVKEKEVRNVIQSIMPEDLSDFFFFDTERVANVGESKDLTKSVKSLLGLSVLDSALKHIGDKNHRISVLGRLYGELDQEGDEQARKALQEIQDAEEKREENAERIEQCEHEHESLSARLDQLNNILRANEDAMEAQREKESLEKSVAEDEKAMAKTMEVLQLDFSRSSLTYFVVPLVDQAEELLKATKLDDKGVRDLTRPTLEELLTRGTCVCGLRFDEHPDAVEHIYEEMKYCPPESIGNSVRNYRDVLRAHRGDQAAVLAGMNDRQASIRSALARIQDNEDRIEELSVNISRAADLGKYENERNHVKGQLKVLETKRINLLAEQKDLDNKIESSKKLHDKVSIVTEKNRKVATYIAYAEELQKWVEVTYKEKESNVRISLQERVNDIFNQMYHGSRKVVIDSKYHVELLSSVAETELLTGESEGLNRVKSFAFIAGLVSLAKEKIVSATGDSEFDFSSEPYPLVMDAPFSNTDEVHIANISKVLPEASEQVIMFVMQKDWRYAEPVLGSKVGKKLKLDKMSEQHTVLRGI